MASWAPPANLPLRGDQDFSRDAYLELLTAAPAEKGLEVTPRIVQPTASTSPVASGLGSL